MEETVEVKTEEATKVESENPPVRTDNPDVFSLMMEQRVHNQKMHRLMKIAAGCMIGILAVVVLAAVLTLPRVLSLLSDAQTVTAQVQEIADQAGDVLGDAREIATQVKNGDPKKLMDSISSLAEEGEDAVQECAEQVKRAVDILDQMDVDSLNTAVDNLSKAISPLAKLFGGK